MREFSRVTSPSQRLFQLSAKFYSMGTVQTNVEEAAGSGQQYTLVVAVANPANVDQLMRTATDLAADTGGKIHVVTVVHKPTTSPFLLFSEDQIKTEFAADREVVLDEAVAAAEDTGVAVEDHLVVGSDVSDALLSVVEDLEANALLIGWQHRPRPADIVLGTTVDPLVRRAPCDIYVERVGQTADTVDAVLLPTDGGPHVEPATDLVGAIARANEATVSVVSYVMAGASDEERATARDHVRQAADRLSSVPVETAVREAEIVSDAIVAATAEHDLVVLGATREHRFRKRVVGSVAETVGQSVTVPVVIAKRETEGSLLESVLDWL